LIRHRRFLRHPRGRNRTRSLRTCRSTRFGLVDAACEHPHTAPADRWWVNQQDPAGQARGDCCSSSHLDGWSHWKVLVTPSTAVGRSNSLRWCATFSRSSRSESDRRSLTAQHLACYLGACRTALAAPLSAGSSPAHTCAGARLQQLGVKLSCSASIVSLPASDARRSRGIMHAFPPDLRKQAPGGYR